MPALVHQQKQTTIAEMMLQVITKLLSTTDRESSSFLGLLITMLKKICSFLNLKEDTSTQIPDVNFNTKYRLFWQDQSFSLALIILPILNIPKYILGERWQFSVVPLSPEKSNSTDWSTWINYPFYGMGAYGYATSGGVFFDTRSS